MDADHPHPLRFHVIEGAPVGLGAFDADLRCAWVNPALAELNHLPAEEIVGRRPSEIHGELGARAEERLRQVEAARDAAPGPR